MTPLPGLKLSIKVMLSLTSKEFGATTVSSSTYRDFVRASIYLKVDFFIINPKDVSLYVDFFLNYLCVCLKLFFYLLDWPPLELDALSMCSFHILRVSCLLVYMLLWVLARMNSFLAFVSLLFEEPLDGLHLSNIVFYFAIFYLPFLSLLSSLNDCSSSSTSWITFISFYKGFKSCVSCFSTGYSCSSLELYYWYEILFSELSSIDEVELCY